MQINTDARSTVPVSALSSEQSSSQASQAEQILPVSLSSEYRSALHATGDFFPAVSVHRPSLAKANTTIDSRNASSLAYLQPSLQHILRYRYPKLPTSHLSYLALPCNTPLTNSLPTFLLQGTSSTPPCGPCMLSLSLFFPSPLLPPKPKHTPTTI